MSELDENELALEEPTREEATEEPAANAAALTPVNFNDRVLFVGKTQSGKTTFARFMFDELRVRRFAIDPKARLHFPGVEPVRRVRDIDERAPLIHYQPSQLSVREYNELYDVVWQLGPPMVVFLDEAMGPTTQSRWPERMLITVTQGAEIGIGHWACSQRPVGIAPCLRTEAEHIFMFVPRPHELNIKALSIEVGLSDQELADRFDQLHQQEGLHSFLWYCRHTNELVACAPIPA